MINRMIIILRCSNGTWECRMVDGTHCRMIEPAHMSKAPDTIVEMSPVTLWQYNLANSTYVFLAGYAASRHHRHNKGQVQ